MDTDTKSEEETHQSLPDCEQLLECVQQNATKDRQNMVKRYEQQHQAEICILGNIVTVHIPRYPYV